MWKEKLRVSTRMPAICIRSTSSADSCPIFISRSYNSSKSHSSSFFSPFSACSSRSLGRAEANLFLFAKCLLLTAPSSVLRINNGNQSVKNGNFFCSQPKSAEKFQCWNCGAGPESATPFLFCQACRSVQPVDESIDYFQIFALRREYGIVLEELEKKYKDWQKKLHPDLVHSKSKREREYAAEQSARVIGAYRTLADPLSRAIYIVKLEGVEVDEEERITEPDLLTEVISLTIMKILTDNVKLLELNISNDAMHVGSQRKRPLCIITRIMELRESVDEANDTQSLNKIQYQLQEKLQHCSNLFEESYKRRNYEHALASVRRMTYYRRANEEIVKKL